MKEHATHPLFSGDYMPHGMCFAWEPSILWTTIISDLMIATSYFSIPIAILYYFHKRPPQKYVFLFWLFAAFIFLCGLTHLYSIYTLYNGYYGIHAIIKALTAMVSFVTAIAVYRYLPLALRIPSPSELMTEKTKAAENALFKVLSENSPVGLVLINESFQIRHINRVASMIFGYSADDLIGRPIGQLLPKTIRDKHISLMQQYIKSPTDAYQMNSGRIVKGINASGEEINIEISLSSGEYLGERLVFASVVDCQEKVKSDDLLRQSLMKLDRIIDSSESGLWEWNIQTNEVWQSPKTFHLIGSDPTQEPSFDLWRKHIHPEFTDAVMEQVNMAVKNKSDFYMEYKGKTEDGDYQWFRSKGKMTLLRNQPYLLSGTITNIHTEITYGKSIQDKNTYLEKVINRSISGLYIYSFTENKNVYINEEYTSITGYSLEDLNAFSEENDFATLFHPDDLPMVMKHIDTVTHSQDGNVYSIQYQFRHKNGNWIWCLSRDSVFNFNEEGKPIEMLGTFIDITPIKRSEVIQRKLLKDFQNTFEMAAVGVAHVALDGSWIKVNNKVCEILEYSREELLDIDFQTITYPDDLGIDMDHVNELINGLSDSYDMEKRYITKSGKIIWANLTVSIVRKDDASPDYFISVIEDIANRKQIEEDQKKLNQELIRSNDQLTRFAYSASHDMQEPLRKITSFATSLLSRLGDQVLDEQSKFELDRISYAARRMKKMIDKLLELSRASNKELTLNKESAKEVLLDAQEQLSVALFESNATLEITGNGDIYCDRVVIASVFENILGNCIKYRHKDRPILIHINITNDEDKLTRIEIQDNGIGFDNQYAEEILEPFKRLVPNSEVEGTGMGLAICKQLISLHKGSMQAEGNPNKGAKFTITLRSEEWEIS